jgi:hypothetical protein
MMFVYGSEIYLKLKLYLNREPGKIMYVPTRYLEIIVISELGKVRIIP